MYIEHFVWMSHSNAKLYPVFQNPPFSVNHDNNGPDSETSEGAIQTAQIPIMGVIADHPTIYVALWAVNGVGTIGKQIL